MEPFIGQIMMVGFNFAPRGWALCEGQLLPIAQYTALFSLLGTTYGGDGRTTFGLPDLRGRAAVGVGNGPGLTNRSWGQKGGTETNTLNTTQIPAHHHGLQTGNVSIPVSTEDANQDEAAGNYLANGTFYHSGNTGTYGGGPVALAGNTANTGGGQAVNNMQPFLGMYYVIALQGIFPSRS